MIFKLLFSDCKGFLSAAEYKNQLDSSKHFNSSADGRLLSVFGPEFSARRL